MDVGTSKHYARGRKFRKSVYGSSCDQIGGRAGEVGDKKYYDPRKA